MADVPSHTGGSVYKYNNFQVQPLRFCRCVSMLPSAGRSFDVRGAYLGDVLSA